MKALGTRHNMDITIEGFHSWMWSGLSFLLPFLFIGYVFQAFNAWTLFKLSGHPDASWQVPVMSLLFTVLFIGNAVTTLLVVPQKMRERVKERYRLMSLSWSLKIRQQIKVRGNKDVGIFLSNFNFFQGMKTDNKAKGDKTGNEENEKEK